MDKSRDQFEILHALIEAQEERLNEFQAQIFMICISLILILPAVMLIK